MHCLGIAVLGILNKKHHQKGHNRGTGVDDELPGIRKMKRRPGQCPDRNDHDGTDECPCRAEYLRGPASEDTKSVPHPAEEVASLDFLMGIMVCDHPSNSFGRTASVARIVDFLAQWANN